MKSRILQRLLDLVFIRVSSVFHPWLQFVENTTMLFAQLPLFPESASTLAEEVDGLFFFILAVTVFFTLLVAFLVLFFIVKYRRRSPSDRPAAIHGSLALEL